MKRAFDVIVQRGSDGIFVAEVPALPGCYTQAPTLEELEVRVREVIELCLEDEEPESPDFIAVQRVLGEA
ncbi:MAG: type II toxin-antitoxin system HicB family antitoxin [Planctomycetota bacterium]